MGLHLSIELDFLELWGHIKLFVFSPRLLHIALDQLVLERKNLAQLLRLLSLLFHFLQGAHSRLIILICSPGVFTVVAHKSRMHGGL